MMVTVRMPGPNHDAPAHVRRDGHMHTVQIDVELLDLYLGSEFNVSFTRQEVPATQSASWKKGSHRCDHYRCARSAPGVALRTSTISCRARTATARASAARLRNSAGSHSGASGRA